MVYQEQNHGLPAVDRCGEEANFAKIKNVPPVMTSRPYLLLLLVLFNCKKEPDPVINTLPPASAAPVAEFSLAGGNCAAPCEITFTNTSKNATTFEWAFGDGATSVTKDPIYTYKTAGTFTVKLTANGSGSSSNSSTQEVNIAKPTVAAPVADFTFPATDFRFPTEVPFTNASKNATSYTWDFGDGTPWSFEVSPKYTYKKTGTYTVKLTCVGPGGTAQITKPVTIKEPCLSMTLHSGNKQSWDKAHLGIFTTPIGVSVSAGAGPAKEGTVVTWKTSTETVVTSVGTRGLAYFSRTSKASTELPGVVASIEGVPGCSTEPLSVTFTDDINVPTTIQLVSATLDQKVSPCASGGKNGTLVTPTITFSTPGNLSPYFIRLVEQFRGGSSLVFKNTNWDSKSAPTFTVSNNTIRVSSCYLYGNDLSGNFQYFIELYEKDAAGNPIGKARISNTSILIKTTKLPDSGRIGQ